MIHLFAQNLMIKQFYLTQCEDPIRATNPGQRIPGSNDSEGALHFPQSLSIR